MASKFGKREKIVVGSIIGILAIAGIHFFLFADRATQTAALRDEVKKLAEENAALPEIRDPKMIETLKQKTVEDQRVLWEAAFKMDLLMEPFVMEDSGNTEPKKPLEDDKDYTKKLAAYNKKLAAYDAANRPKQVAADAIILDQFERILEMKQPYETGEKYKTDLPLAIPEATGNAPVVKLKFLDDGATGWNFPVALSKPSANRANLWDQVNSLYAKWDVLRLLDENSENYMSANLDYVDELKKIGLDVNTFQSLKKLNENLPQYVKALYAMTIWRQREPGQTVRVGGNEDLTLDLLMKIFDVQLPRFKDVAFLNRQLSVLQNVLALARRNRIEEIRIVQLPSDQRPMAHYDEKVLKDAREKKEVKPVAPKKSLIADNPTGGADGMATYTPTPTPAPTGMAMAPKKTISGGLMNGVACMIKFRYLATNENSTRFLYDIVSDPRSYGISALDIKTEFQGEVFDGKILVDLTIDAPVAIFGVSVPGDLIDPKTYKPLSKVGEEMLAAKIEEDKKSGNSVNDKVMKALRDAGIDPDKDTSTPLTLAQALTFVPPKKDAKPGAPKPGAPAPAAARPGAPAPNPPVGAPGAAPNPAAPAAANPPAAAPTAATPAARAEATPAAPAGSPTTTAPVAPSPAAAAPVAPTPAAPAAGSPPAAAAPAPR